jgi:hypothetical protein
LKPNLLFDPRREHLPVPTTENRSRSRAGAVKAGRAARGHPSGLGLDWPEHGGKIGWSGTERASLSNFKPVVFDHFCAAANIRSNPNFYILLRRLPHPRILIFTTSSS